MSILSKQLETYSVICSLLAWRSMNEIVITEPLVGKPVAEGELISCFVKVGFSFLLLGTSKGRLLTFQIIDAAGGGELGSYRCVLCTTQERHSSAVTAAAYGEDSLLVATGGMDAACCVQPLCELVSASPLGVHSRGTWKITGHYFPVVAVQFFGAGDLLATLSVDGTLRVDVASQCGSAPPLAVIACGFPAASLAISLDGTFCVVGGKQVTAVDLYHGSRNAGGEAGDSAGPLSAPLRWSNEEEGERMSSLESDACACVRDVCFDENDGGSLRAVFEFASGAGDGTLCRFQATWRHLMEVPNLVPLPITTTPSGSPAWRLRFPPPSATTASLNKYLAELPPALPTKRFHTLNYMIEFLRDASEKVEEEASELALAIQDALPAA